MMNILLGILKGIGILLAVIFGLLLFLFLILCFGPIGYGGKGSWQKEKRIGGYINWLFFVLRGRADYSTEEGLRWQIRLFGILVASNDEEFNRKKEEKRRKKEACRALKETKKKEKEILSPESHMDEENVEVQDGQFREGETAVIEPEPSLDESVLETGTEDNPSDQKDASKQSFSARIKQGFSSVAGKVRSILEKIRKLIDKIKNIPAKIGEIITSIREKIEFVSRVKEFLFGEQNKEGFHHIWKNIKKMLLHILPVKIRGEVTFGVEDPYTMGQILTVLGMLYPVYQDKLTLHPEFENQILEGDVEWKGRIIPGYLLWKGIVIIANREVRRIIKEGTEYIRRK